MEYFISSSAPKLMHFETSEKLREWLTLVRDIGENETFKIIKDEIKQEKYEYNTISVQVSVITSLLCYTVL